MRKHIPHERFNDRVNFFYEGKHIPEWGSENKDDAWGKENSDNADTACAVAIDKKGNLACATSTRGIAGKRKGRVSGAALVGCGGYANDKGAAATTGHGEKLIKLTLARQVVIEMENGRNAQEATEEAVKLLTEKLKGHGGAIAIDKNGNFGKAFSTPLMAWASVKDDQLKDGFEKDEEGNAKLLYNERF
ncbi:isoaspartyl peptidase/L-asparaginase-like [Xenia sp. Carnegie-2017]|uniref:isoaspartyl peptidase/L-asparaginase-like n=1 Tax=Xenia sp. Carnegie-2017 TaxID=2897299 RepID=UPI001F03D1EF|nr:isoaspartyl peptidase/L-asparaginase-like [Xenia sp. Carnegie-2017]